MGYAAMDLLLDLIEKRTTETTRWFNVNIVARASTQRE
jgi:DNA-binding LacI/PurR family transcriptional regulator